jgi:hypothetical protein
VPRGAVEPGRGAQIDYGRLGMWCDPESGRRVAVWVFAMILSCSRALFVQPVLKMGEERFPQMQFRTTSPNSTAASPSYGTANGAGASRRLASGSRL